MAICFNIEECEEMISKIKKSKEENPDGFKGEPYNYICSVCGWYNHEEYCYCDHSD